MPDARSAPDVENYAVSSKSPLSFGSASVRLASAARSFWSRRT